MVQHAPNDTQTSPIHTCTHHTHILSLSLTHTHTHHQHTHTRHPCSLRWALGSVGRVHTIFAPFKCYFFHFYLLAAFLGLSQAGPGYFRTLPCYKHTLSLTHTHTHTHTYTHTHTHTHKYTYVYILKKIRRVQVIFAPSPGTFDLNNKHIGFLNNKYRYCTRF
jgi:hypothetical protein